MSKIPNGLFAASSIVTTSGNTITLGSAGGAGGSGAAGTTTISGGLNTISIGGAGGAGGYATTGTSWTTYTPTASLSWIQHNKGALLRLATLLGIKAPKLEGHCFYDSIRFCTWAFRDGKWYKASI